ncbi:MAG: hypothetical protein LBK13_11085 [Spirochaetales bacterium]|nr:hypothetical protein [Spirochaetales bacterium]
MAPGIFLYFTEYHNVLEFAALDPVQNLYNFASILELGAFLAQSAKNRAFRSNLFYRFAVKKDFRCNAPEDGRFPIGMDCSGRYRAPGIPCAAQRRTPAKSLRDFAGHHPAPLPPQFSPVKMATAGLQHIIAGGNYVPRKLPQAISWPGFELPLKPRRQPPVFAMRFVAPQKIAFAGARARDRSGKPTGPPQGGPRTWSGKPGFFARMAGKKRRPKSFGKNAAQV